MYTMFNISKSAMLANQNKMDIISNNISNVNTSGYKKLNVEFSDLVSISLDKHSYPVNDSNSYKGMGVKTSSPIRINDQGSIKQTGYSTDLAIDGEGYFRLIDKDGNNVYSRNGEFLIDSFGRIVDNNGNILDINFNENLGYNNLNIKSDNFSISKSGDVYVDNKVVGSISLYNTSSNDAFLSNGDNTFTLKNNYNINEVNGSSIIQGHVEMSNVSLQDEMINMITTQRALQVSSKGIQTADDMWSIANNLRSR